MSFKYINPGYANLLDVEGGVTVEDSTKSRTGVGFYQPVQDKGINIPALQKGFCARFDVYIPESGQEPVAVAVKTVLYRCMHGISISLKADNIEFNFYTSGTQAYYKFATWRNKQEMEDSLNFRFGQVNSFWYSVKTDGSIGTSKFFINGKLIFTKGNLKVSSVEEGQFSIYSSNEHGLLSNIIISEAEIDLHEVVSIIPLASTSTDMTSLEDGEYRADSPNQKLLSAVDVASMISAYGPLSKVTGIAIVGNPARKTEESAIKLTALSVKDGVESEHGTKEPKSTQEAAVMDFHDTDLTLADLSGMKFGWKASV